MIEARVITDPMCVASWQHEPVLRRLALELGDGVRWRYVMGGLARDIDAARREHFLHEWLEQADDGMPLDPRIWTEGPPATSYPACMAVCAAREQGPQAEARCLRALREGLLCFRRKLDNVEALVEEARRAGLDVERFRVDLGSHAIVEAFGADIAEARKVPQEAREQDAVSTDERERERVVFPTVNFIGEDGTRRVIAGRHELDDYLTAARSLGAQPQAAPLGAMDALRRHGRLATREVEVLCDLPEVRAAQELWSLAAEWRVRPVPVLTGTLWEPA